MSPTNGGIASPTDPPERMSLLDGFGLVLFGSLAGWLAGAVAAFLSWFSSCGNLMIGHSEAEIPTNAGIIRTLLGYVFALAVASVLPLFALWRETAADRRVGRLVVWSVLAVAPMLVLVPEIVDAGRARLAADPGAYCIRPGYEGG